VRRSPFGGRLTSAQVDGMEILAEWERRCPRTFAPLPTCWRPSSRDGPDHAADPRMRWWEGSARQALPSMGGEGFVQVTGRPIIANSVPRSPDSCWN